MAKQSINNPFSKSDLRIPKMYYDKFVRYCQTKGSESPDVAPFPRYLDFWYLAICVAARSELQPVDTKGLEMHKFIEGNILSDEPARVHTLMMLAILYAEDGVKVLLEPSKMISILNGLAGAGIPKVFDMLKEGGGEPIWNLSDELDVLIRS